MATTEFDYLRTQLDARREKLESALRVSPENANLVHLMQEVDAALERMENGTYGICEACHEPVEQDRLLADPLICYCLDHLTPEQRRKLEQDLELAARIQSALLPARNLHLSGWDIHYHYEPAGPVSGDYCDLIPRNGAAGDLYFLVGDVAGKGVAASLLMSQLHAMFRSLVSSELPVDKLVESANRMFCESTLSGQYATLVCGRACASGEIEICNAGHPPVLLAQSNRVREVEASGVPLGLFCNAVYGSERARLAPGESLFLYTDGLSEAHDRGNVEYGKTRLSRVVGEHHARGAQALAAACLADVRAFATGARRSDDLTILVLRRTN